MASRTRSTGVLVPPGPQRTGRVGELSAQVGAAEEAVRWVLEQLLASPSVFDDPQLLWQAGRYLAAGAELGEVLRLARAELPGFAEGDGSAGSAAQGAATVHRLVS
jgi:hypothetical protein